MTFDVVITTYNRREKVTNFCAELALCSLKPKKLIVVDSSDESNEFIASQESITYIRSFRKSQPYQRYLGYMSSSADVVIFFDDDLQIIDRNLFHDVINQFKSDSSLVGLGLGINYQNTITQKLGDYSQSRFNKIRSFFKRKIHLGDITRFGETNILPTKDIIMKYLPGPNMCFKREVLANIFDEQLFKLFELRLGMGEDKVISMRVSSKGKIMYLGSKFYLEHPANDSTYYSNEIEFRAKVIYSRIWIANQYNKLWPNKLNNTLIIIYLLKNLIFSIGNRIKIRAFILSLIYIKKYGFHQNKLNQ